MKKILSTPAAAAVGLLVLLGPAQALGSPSAASEGASAQAQRAENPSKAAKSALLKAVKKLDQYAAKHGSPPQDKAGIKLVQAGSPAGVLVTYRKVSGGRQGYCAAAVPTVAISKKVWVHDSWLRKTWQAPRTQVTKPGGACAAAAKSSSGYGQSEMKLADSDVNRVVDAIDNYGDSDEVDYLPPTIDVAFLAANGISLKPGSHIVGFDLYGPETWDFRVCVVRDSGAWATYDEKKAAVVAKGTTGAACSY